MANLSSSSTLAQVEAEYDNNASYAEDLDTTKCRRFITACRILIRRTASSTTKGSNSLSFPTSLLQRELEKAQRWLEAHDNDQRAGPVTTRPDFRNFRWSG